MTAPERPVEHRAPRFSLTIIGIVMLIGLAVVAAIMIETDKGEDQRFLLLVGMIGTTVTALLTVYRTERNAEAIELRTTYLKDVLEQRSEEIKTTAKADLEEVKHKIDENTVISQQAFKEANNFNRKLGHISSRFDELLIVENGDVESENTKGTTTSRDNPVSKGRPRAILRRVSRARGRRKSV